MQRRVPQFLGLYLGSGWVLLEFSDWVVERYLLSPYWVDLVLMVWLLMLPAVAVTAWFHGKPGPDPWSRNQRLFVGGNAILAAGVLLALATSRDLGAMTEMVTVVDEAGVSQERRVAKQEYRRRIALFMVENRTGNSDYDWMEIGLPILMELDLYQDVFIDLRGPEHFSSLLRDAGVEDQGAAPLGLQRQLADRKYLDWFTSGYIVMTDGAPELHMTLHNTDSGASQEPIVVSTAPLFASVDYVTKELRRALEVPSNYEGAKGDLPVGQITTESEEAFKEAAIGYREIFVNQDWATASAALERATAIDPGYAHAQLGLYTTMMAQNRTEEAIAAVNAAISNLYRLPERIQFLAKTEYFMVARQDIASAITILEMATTLYPADVDALFLLGQLQEATGNREPAVKAFEQLLQQDPNRFDALLILGKLQERAGAYDDARVYYQRYVEARPTDKEGPLALGGLDTLLGAHGDALESYRTASLLAPTDPSIITRMASAYFNQGDFDRSLSQLELALGTAQHPGQRAEVEAALMRHHLGRGHVAKAVEYFEAFKQSLIDSVPPIFVAIRQQDGVNALLAAGRDDELKRIAEGLQSIAPPMNKMVYSVNLNIAIDNKDLAGISEALTGMDALIQDLGRAEFTSQRSHGQGVKAELEGDLDAALDAYLTALDILPLRAHWHEDAARVLRKQGELDEAYARISMGLTVRPMSGKLNTEAARISIARKDEAAANRHLDAAERVWSTADPGYLPSQALQELRRTLVAAN